MPPTINLLVDIIRCIVNYWFSFRYSFEKHKFANCSDTKPIYYKVSYFNRKFHNILPKTQFTLLLTPIKRPIKLGAHARSSVRRRLRSSLSTSF